jgi:hypothetical protein
MRLVKLLVELEAVVNSIFARSRSVGSNFTEDPPLVW